ncbi:hypothetical protein P3S67_018019 [Capsicum chacoense]
MCSKITVLVSVMAPNLKLHVGNISYFDDPTYYRNVVGALQYVTLTRSNLAFVVNKLVLHAFTYFDCTVSLNDHKSTGSYVIYLGKALVSWSSKQQSLLPLSMVLLSLLDFNLCCLNLTFQSAALVIFGVTT